MYVELLQNEAQRRSWAFYETVSIFFVGIRQSSYAAP